MIDRSYLPYQAAREYLDRGMAKWMGFFLSEHSTALVKEDDTIDYSEQMDTERLILLLSQAYTNRLDILLYTRKRKQPFLGQVIEIKEESIFFRSNEKMLEISFADIIKLEH